MKRELLISWIHKTLSLDLGDRIYIPGETRESCQKELKRFQKEIEILYQIDPFLTGTITPSYIFKDKQHWTVLERTIGSPLTGFIKKASGEVSKVTLDFKPETEIEPEIETETEKEENPHAQMYHNPEQS